MKFEAVEYINLNSRQQESYNFQKVAAKLADYGFNCVRLSDDWQGADFIAIHINGETFLKVQLKSRLTIDKKYCGKDIYVAFRYFDDWYVYPHDQVQDALIKSGHMINSETWKTHNSYSWPHISKSILEILAPFKVASENMRDGSNAKLNESPNSESTEIC